MPSGDTLKFRGCAENLGGLARGCSAAPLARVPRRLVQIDFSLLRDRRFLVSVLSVSKIEETVLSRFSSTIKAVKNMDENLADELIASYRNDLGKISDKLVAASISGDVEIGKENKTASVALYARYLKRIGAHLKNITSLVVNPFESIGYIK